MRRCPEKVYWHKYQSPNRAAAPFNEPTSSAIHPEFLRRKIEELRIPKQLNERLRIVGRQVHGPGTAAGSTRDG
jgi:hypothetical protein